jgi:hypothetical protein
MLLLYNNIYENHSFKVLTVFARWGVTAFLGRILKCTELFAMILKN